ncbi:hypothetical protein [Rhodopirellula sp. SWK7]|uniref:hypothetical protein n=1 Tax=Rhodopirellula sp. SWK7 TaxID=595460 RepID=UPI0002BE5DB0|nr:hypothetical protein [Rhodopirellula sp. SWK7]EMI46336.1 hypothetical protein RRSWK_01073 [Rhodopirellula sp. SWK7]
MRILSASIFETRHLPPSPWEQPGAWMLRRLRVTLGIGLVLLVVQAGSAVSKKGLPERSGISPVNGASSTIMASNFAEPTFAGASLNMNSDHNTLTRKPFASANSAPSFGSQPRAVLPQGWRRTSSGWQHVSTWSAIPQKTVSLTERVIAQRDAEPVWLREAMETLRQIHPGCFALVQLMAVGVLFAFSRHRGDQTCQPKRRYFFREPTRLAR